jgi:hypothetical protein
MRSCGPLDAAERLGYGKRLSGRLGQEWATAVTAVTDEVNSRPELERLLTRENEHSQHLPVERFTLIIGRPQCEQIGRCFMRIGRVMTLMAAFPIGASQLPAGPRDIREPARRDRGKP